MPDRDGPIATVPIARSIPRLVGPPLVAVGLGVVAVAAGILLLPGLSGIAVAALGAMVVAFGVAAVVILLGVRLDVEEAAVIVRRPGVERRYELVPGPVTRVRLRGDDASSLRATRSLPGWQLGPARLREEEDVEVVRLAPTDTAILVPTDRGRLAIAAADERVLLSALAEAAKARQRLAELAADEDDAPDADTEAAPGVPVAVTRGPDPVEMTGIERARWESEQAALREAAEREAADRAEAERAAAAREEEERETARLSVASGVDADGAAPAVGSVAHAARAAEAAADQPDRPGAGRRRLPIRRPHPSAGLVVLPIAGAGIAWAIGLALGRMPDPETEIGRLTALALVLTGPAATIGAIVARVWWPRLVAVVVAGGLAGAVFVGRSFIGG